MKIKRSVYNQIIDQISDSLPETGGILGGDRDVVTHSYSDKGNPSSKMCSYSPNIKLINREIRRWQDDNISFLGIYHTHYWGVETLSEGDIKYISEIVGNMPDSIRMLYFPIIVMPDRVMVCYVAKNNMGRITIDNEKIIICD